MNAATEGRSTVIGGFGDRRQAEAAVGDLCQTGFREDQIRVEEIRYYRGESEEGRTRVIIQADGRSDEAATTLRRHGDVEVHTAADSAAPPPRTGEGATIQLHAEELHPHKQFVETGEIRVRKELVTEHRTIEVPVQWEEIVIERYAPAGAAVSASASDLRPGEELRIPVRRERVTVEKRPVVKEEVRVGKRVVQGTERVDGEVRKEEVRVVRVERAGDADGPAAAARDTNTAGSDEAAARDTNTAGSDEAMIRQQAYLKWLEEGRPDGQDRRHYFEAAQEVRA
jgi:uncharacterized protein (TIGR02271 family)